MNASAPSRASTPARAWRRALETTAKATRDPRRVLPSAVSEWARRYGDAPALIGVAETLSFRELEARMNRYSRWALSLDVAKGETVALMLGNCPDYFAIWLGLTQIGAIVALVSVDLRGAGLAHALRVANAGRLIVAAGSAAVIDSDVEIWTHGGGALDRRVDLAVADFSPEPLRPDEAREVTLADRALRIFTSGTTGLPKAAEVSHRRIIAWTHWFAGLADLTSRDRLYDCLPMHHSVGGVVAIGAPLVNGGSVVIAERFSASRFWDDVARYECTAFQYIGELCRYLAAAPTRAAEKEHGLRIAIGNGLSGEVWQKCLDRFGPLRVVEFYASTEGNVWLYNVENRIGSIGRVPPYLAAREPIALARFDADAQAPLRDADGFCRRCDDGEVGEALGRIESHGDAKFEGYSQAAETAKKVMRDVFAPGDAWMRTGDLMRRDAEGFYTFVDRIGDTFRWKGENVATTEVAAALSACPGIAEAIVYGVAVPGADGRAGMALLRLNGKLDLEALARGLAALPRPARPLFLRVAREIEATETFKPKRRAYVEQGFDPSRSEDPIFVLEGDSGYAPLDGTRYAAIMGGAARL
jgi:fatty-acyl-CoA synthase